MFNILVDDFNIIKFETFITRKNYSLKFTNIIEKNIKTIDTRTDL
jgi:hypothetical protein